MTGGRVPGITGRSTAPASDPASACQSGGPPSCSFVPERVRGPHSGGGPGSSTRPRWHRPPRRIPPPRPGAGMSAGPSGAGDSRCHGGHADHDRRRYVRRAKESFPVVRGVAQRDGARARPRTRDSRDLVGCASSRQRHETGRFLVDLPVMADDRMLDLVGRPGGPLADAALWHLEVHRARHLTPSIHRVVLTAPGIDGLQLRRGPGPHAQGSPCGDRVVNRRYTIRRFDPISAAVTSTSPCTGRAPERIGFVQPGSVTASTPSAHAGRSPFAAMPTGTSSWSTRPGCRARWR